VNLITFSIRTKGLHNFARRLWTVFARFGFSEAKMHRALFAVMDALREHNGAPTFFIPAVVLERHPELIANIAQHGAEIGIHGYVHNDYRTLSEPEQYRQTQQAISVFQKTRTPYQGFRNPYLGWTEASLRVFTKLAFGYESNEAVLHDVIDVASLSPTLKDGYKKSQALYQVLPANEYTLRPHFEGGLLRIPTSVPDDEMLFDRLRMSAEEVGQAWRQVMQNVYQYGGLYVLNLHPERGTLCRHALDLLLDCAHSRPQPVWLARLEDIAQWWQERSQFRLNITPLTTDYWLVEAKCSPRASLLARHLTVDYQTTTEWSDGEDRVCGHRCIVQSKVCPCIGLSQQTPQEVLNFLYEQGYPAMRCSNEDASRYTLYLDLPEGLGETRAEQLQRRSALVQKIEHLKAPFLHFGCWPDGNRAALSITGDIDSVTVQDFFLRILEVSRSK